MSLARFLALACLVLSPTLLPLASSDVTPDQDLSSSEEDGGRGGQEEGGPPETTWGATLSEQTGQFLSDPEKWRWPAPITPGTEKTVHDTLIKWCGPAYAEAIRDAAEKQRTWSRLMVERAQRYNEWQRCQQERAIREKELDTECTRAKIQLTSELDRDKQTLQIQCESQRTLLKSDLEACELKLKSKEEAVCKREVENEKAACAHTKRGLKANLTACLQKGRVGNEARVAELELTSAKFEQDKEQWFKERDDLLAILAQCRPARAHSEARLREVLADGTIDALERAALWLQVVLGVLVAVLISLLSTILYLSVHEDKPTGSGSYGWVGAQPASRMKLVSPDVARSMLEDAFEGRTLTRLPVVLTTAVQQEQDSGVPVVFLLVPVNVASSRRFSLFNSGGDYVPHVEKAKEIVAKAFERSRLVVVLYEGNGSLFSEKTLQSLRLNPDKVAYEAVPKDMDFPKSHNLVVPWVDKALGVRATDSERESDLTATIKTQPWAQYLLMRSGRWGAAHAQL